MSKDFIARLKEFALNQIEMEKEQLDEAISLGNRNSYSAGYSGGVMQTASVIQELCDEELRKL